MGGHRGGLGPNEVEYVATWLPMSSRPEQLVPCLPLPLVAQAVPLGAAVSPNPLTVPFLSAFLPC